MPWHTLASSISITFYAREFLQHHTNHASVLSGIHIVAYSLVPPINLFNDNTLFSRYILQSCPTYPISMFKTWSTLQQKKSYLPKSNYRYNYYADSNEAILFSLWKDVLQEFILEIFYKSCFGLLYGVLVSSSFFPQCVVRFALILLLWVFTKQLESFCEVGFPLKVFM